LPGEHIDISSLTYFSTLVSAFIPTKFYDFRPAEIILDNFESKHADITALSFEANSIKSLSCMHVVEHIGLGRYGDPLDVDGDLKAIKELKRVLAVGGNLLFVVPIGGIPKIMFNAHRIYSYEQILSYFSNFELIEFSLIPDTSSEGLILNASSEMADKQNYGCGCFWFKKIQKI
jgi:SAM-dependent methyltransferase